MVRGAPLTRNISIYHYFQIQKICRICLKEYIKTVYLLFYNINLEIIIKKVVLKNIHKLTLNED